MAGREAEAVFLYMVAASWAGMIGYAIGRLADKNAIPDPKLRKPVEERESVIKLLDEE